MWKPIARALTASTMAVLLAAPVLRSQTTLQDSALAAATADALEPGVRAALKDGQPVSFEYNSPWGQTVKSHLEESLGLSLASEHRRGASRILLGDPRLDADTAFVEVWFGRCEAVADTERLKIRMYSFAFEREALEWTLSRADRLGTKESSCDGDWKEPAPVQT
jgi:hypothetical protein